MDGRVRWSAKRDCGFTSEIRLFKSTGDLREVFFLCELRLGMMGAQAGWQWIICDSI